MSDVWSPQGAVKKEFFEPPFREPKTGGQVMFSVKSGKKTPVQYMDNENVNIDTARRLDPNFGADGGNSRHVEALGLTLSMLQILLLDA